MNKMKKEKEKRNPEEKKQKKKNKNKSVLRFERLELARACHRSATTTSLSFPL